MIKMKKYIYFDKYCIMMDTIFIKTRDNIVFEIDKDKWCKKCIYINKLYLHHNNGVLIVNFDSKMFKKLSKFVENSYISQNWIENEQIAIKYGIDVQPSTYIWLLNSQIYPLIVI
jgi:hypothetical protein